MKRYLYFVSYHWQSNGHSQGVGNNTVISPEIDSHEMIRMTEDTIKNTDEKFSQVVLLNLVKLREIEEEDHE